MLGPIKAKNNIQSTAKRICQKVDKTAFLDLKYRLCRTEGVRSALQTRVPFLFFWTALFFFFLRLEGTFFLSLLSAIFFFWVRNLVFSDFHFFRRPFFSLQLGTKKSEVGRKNWPHRPLYAPFFFILKAPSFFFFVLRAVLVRPLCAFFFFTLAILST